MRKKAHQHLIFQSTLPARGATSARQASAGSRPISIHAPRTGSDYMEQFIIDDIEISIYAPRTGSDFLVYD